MRNPIRLVHLLRPKPWAAIALMGIAAWSPAAQAHVMDASGYVTQDVVDICRTVALAHNQNSLIEGPTYTGLAQAHGFAESMLRRPPHTVRGDAAARASYRTLVGPLSFSERNRLTEAFNRIGDVGPVLAPAGTYNTVLIKGTTVSGMRHRLMALVHAVSTGDIALSPNSQIVFLNADRNLLPSETVNTLLNTEPYLKDPTFTPPASCPSNEVEAAQMMWRQLWLPPSLRQIEPLFIQAPAPLATLEDTVHAWVAQSRPAPGKALLVTENPYVTYHQMATSYALQQHGLTGIEISAMGLAGRLEDNNETDILGVRLDNLAASLAVALALQESAEQGIQSALLP